MVSDDTKSFIEGAVLNRLRNNQFKITNYDTLVRASIRFAIEEFEEYIKTKDVVYTEGVKDGNWI